jgi:antitoxin component HigA of HigAB toxin-antitoxin module
MPVAEKKLPIEVSFKPDTPQRVVKEVCTRYAAYIITRDADKVDFFKTNLYKKIADRLTPAKVLRHLREAHSLTQAALGEMLGTNAAHVSDFETGQRGISKDFAKKLSEIFNISADKFI